MSGPKSKSASREEVAGEVARTRPILMSGPMVRALLAGTKTQTRRIVKPQPAATAAFHHLDALNGAVFTDGTVVRCPYTVDGVGRLWVRETFAQYGDPAGFRRVLDAVPQRVGPRGEWIFYRADAPPTVEPPAGWAPSIHMPRAFSRITLDVTEVRVQRLHEITEEDARAEGVDMAANPCGFPATDHFACCEEYPHTPRNRFMRLWESINGPGSWEASPWVWCVSFSRSPPASGGSK